MFILTVESSDQTKFILSLDSSLLWIYLVGPWSKQTPGLVLKPLNKHDIQVFSEVQVSLCVLYFFFYYGFPFKEQAVEFVPILNLTTLNQYQHVSKNCFI